MEKNIDLTAYLKRIGYSGKPKADLSTLQAIQLLHAKTIPFENLDPFTGAAVSLDLPAIEEKIVGNYRGGYCFEQNGLLKAVLQQIGFRVKGLAARVVWNSPSDALTPFSHMLLLVDLEDGQYLADVGFGGMTLTGPLLLKTDTPQVTPHEDFRLIKAGPYYFLEASIKGEWKACYKFHLEEHFEADYEVMNWYTSSHPSSHFTFTLIATKVFDGGRYALRNTELVTHYLDGPSEKQAIGDRRKLEQVLEEVFGLNAPGIAKLGERMDRLF